MIEKRSAGCDATVTAQMHIEVIEIQSVRINLLHTIQIISWSEFLQEFTILMLRSTKLGTLQQYY